MSYPSKKCLLRGLGNFLRPSAWLAGSGLIAQGRFFLQLVGGR